MSTPPVTQAAVRKFWCDSYQSMLRSQKDVTRNEALAMEIVGAHPEFHKDLEQGWASVAKVYQDSHANPFLHLSLHLSVREQLSADMPPGIRALFSELSTAMKSAHEAEHALAECVGHALTRAATLQKPLDPEIYLAEVERRLIEARSH